MIRKAPHFDGAVYDPVKDHVRLTNQLEIIKKVMSDGIFRTVPEISRLTGAPETSVSAQLRNLRKRQFGEYRVPKRRRGGKVGGLWEYQVLPPLEAQDTTGQLRYSYA